MYHWALERRKARLRFRSARATITSIAGAGLEVWGIALFLLIGAAAQQSSWVDAIGWVGLLVLGVSLVLSYAAGPVAARIRS